MNNSRRKNQDSLFQMYMKVAKLAYGNQWKPVKSRDEFKFHSLHLIVGCLTEIDSLFLCQGFESQLLVHFYRIYFIRYTVWKIFF